MVTTLAVVEIHPPAASARPNSPLAGIARRRFGGKSLLEWMVRRASEADRLSGVVVLAENSPLARSLCAHCPPDAHVLFTEATDPLGRLAEAARRLPCKAILRLSVSHPIIDPDLIDRLIMAGSHSGCDYASYCFRDGRAVVESQLGVLAEWCHTDAILRADRLATTPPERAEATRMLHSRPDLFSRHLLELPPRLDREDLRLAICDEEDWEEVPLIVDAIGPESLDWRYITSLLDRQPQMRARMANRNRSELAPY